MVTTRMDRLETLDVEAGRVVIAAFPKPKYLIVETNDEYVVYIEDDHGAFA